MKKKNPSLSIVIPTLNAGSGLRRTLVSLRSQDKYSQAELIIVDSSSNDGTPECARRFDAQVITIDRSDFNHGATRNLGVQESCGDFICLMTQDALPMGSDFLLTLMESIEREGAAGGFARQIPRKDASPLVRRDVESWIAGSEKRRVMEISSNNAFYALSPLNRYMTCVFDNVASMIRREVWEETPFSRIPFGEDIDWAYRVLCGGYKLVYEPEAVVMHSHERSPEYIFQRRAIDHYLLYRLFGVRTTPTRRSAVKGAVAAMLQDASYMMRRPRLSRRWLRTMRQIPRFAWSSAWGQFCGARAAACGEAPPLSHEV
ncbi:MAG: glycosyltransferase family 2 protein [Candidatus Omnitrophica bacterium]|nr:glycosyltransferase family 2 protein [Candidatus Omnitrophota bacterium]